MKDNIENKQAKSNRSGANALDYQAADQRPGKRFSWVARLALTCIAIVLIAIAWRFTHPQSRRLPSGSSGTVAMPPWPENVTDFYQKAISPLLDAALHRNRRAAERAIASLHERFNAHRAGVVLFAEDVSGWGTRFGMIQRFAIDEWDHHWNGNPNAARVTDYIQDKFRSDVLSEPSLQADLEVVIGQYREDMEASRNQLFSEIKLPLRATHSPIALDDSGWDRLCSDIDQRAQRLNAATPRDSVATGLAAIAAGWIGTEAAEMVVAQILARVGATVAVEAAETATAAGGSAMVGGTSAGGGVGSFGGPAGTVIGVGVGLAVGAAIDWWMTERLEAHLEDQCNQFLDTVEAQILEGSGQTSGLRTSFEQAVRLADEHQRQAIIDALTEAQK